MFVGEEKAGVWVFDAQPGASAEGRLEDASPLVRGAAVWALARLMDPARFEALARTRAGAETDAGVRAEWSAAQSA